MLKWGVFETNQQVHVCPCDHRNGAVLEGHWLAADCPCQPFKEEADVLNFLPWETPCPVFIHHDYH